MTLCAENQSAMLLFVYINKVYCRIQMTYFCPLFMYTYGNSVIYTFFMKTHWACKINKKGEQKWNSVIQENNKWSRK